MFYMFTHTLVCGHAVLPAGGTCDQDGCCISDSSRHQSRCCHRGRIPGLATLLCPTWFYFSAKLNIQHHRSFLLLLYAGVTHPGHHHRQSGLSSRLEESLTGRWPPDGQRVSRVDLVLSCRRNKLRRGAHGGQPGKPPGYLRIWGSTQTFSPVLLHAAHRVTVERRFKCLPQG